MARSKLPNSLRWSKLRFRPPYEVDDEPDPLQTYGRQKRDGEVAVLKEREAGARITVLRVPLL
jgi:S-adenosylmethionine synthetase